MLVAHGLSFGYETHQPVLRDLSATLAPGRVCALIGPNAAGKTTLLRLLLGQLTPCSGRVELDGADVARLSPRHRAARLSYVPQSGSVNFAFTVEQVVEMGRHALAGDGRAAVRAALRLCSLDGLRHRVFVALSAGQQQRVLVARALAQAADGGAAMLLDEPVSALDLWHVHATMGMLVERARAGLAVLAVLHDLNLAARYADDVWLLAGGRLSMAGPHHAVLRPEVLEPVYRVPLRVIDGAAGDRPQFVVGD